MLFHEQHGFLITFTEDAPYSALLVGAVELPLARGFKHHFLSLGRTRQAQCQHSTAQQNNAHNHPLVVRGYVTRAASATEWS
jgi:hypothetical protein